MDAEKYISHVAKCACKLFGAAISDYDDYVQVGRVAHLMAEHNWVPAKGAFGKYARVCIRNEIMALAIGSCFSISAPLRLKRLAIKARGLIAEGYGDEAISQQLNIPLPQMRYVRTLALGGIRGV